MGFIVLICAIIIGLSLGVFGSGGAILTLPILIYVIGYEEKLAVISSLLIVAAISTIGSIPNIRKKLVNTKLLSLFAIPGIVGSYLGAYLGSLSAPLVQLLLLAVLVVLAASKMLYFQQPEEDQSEVNSLKLISIAGVIGTITGFVGVGGGFLIVPALMIFARVNFQLASATSLILIAIQSTIAIFSYQQHANSIFSQIDWLFIFIFITAGTLGTYLSIWLKPKLNQELLTRLFAYFLLFIASFILVDRLLL